MTLPGSLTRRLFAAVLLVCCSANTLCAQPAVEGGGEDLEASYRFLVSERSAGGILYPASAGSLQGLLLPLSFLDSPRYWGEYVCGRPGTDCRVVDHYSPDTFTLLPSPSPAGDLQTERVNTHNGASIYDAATWQIAVMLGRVHSQYSLPGNADPYDLISNQNRLLAAGHFGESGNVRDHEARAVTRDRLFVYNRTTIARAAEAYAFRLLPRRWLAADPLAGTSWGHLIATSGLQGAQGDYQAGRVSWTDWKPITGENSWAFLLGPLQAASLHYRQILRQGFVPFSDLAIQNGLALLPAFAAMQSPLGGVYYAPAGTVANQGTDLVDPFFVSVENNLSLYAGLRILEATLRNTLARDRQIHAGDRVRLERALTLCTVMIHGGPLPDGGRTEGLLAFFRSSAWQNGIFVQGGRADAPGAGPRWQPVLSPRAVDVNTWGIAALGPELIDRWHGFGAGYRAWRQVRQWGGFGVGMSLQGVGFSDLDGGGIKEDGTFRQGILSGEWTAGAVTAVRSLIDHYQTLAADSTHGQAAARMVASLKSDEQSMLNGLTELRIDRYAQSSFNEKPYQYSEYFTLSTKPYLYASRRQFLPFGWYANPLPSTCATAWMIMVANRFNPFLPIDDHQ